MLCQQFIGLAVYKIAKVADVHATLTSLSICIIDNKRPSLSDDNAYVQ